MVTEDCWEVVRHCHTVYVSKLWRAEILQFLPSLTVTYFPRLETKEFYFSARSVRSIFHSHHFLFIHPCLN